MRGREAGRGARLDEFATFPERLRVAAETAATRPATTDGWGPAEVVRHLLAVDTGLHQVRLRTLETEAEPRWRFTEPELGETEDAPLPTLLDAFAAARAETVARIQALDDDAWSRTAVHETFGRLDVDGLIGIAADHDAEHLRGLADG